MTGTELQQRRTSLGLSADQVGDWLNEHADQVTAWERIPGKLPGSIARRLEWALATEEQQQKLVAAGHPPCPEAERFFEGIPVDSPGEFQRRLKLADAHAATCQQCQARKAFIDTLPPLPPLPLSPWVNFLGGIMNRVERLPAWLRPGAWGALLIGSMTLLRAVFIMLLQGRAPSRQIGLMVLGAIGVGAYGGVVGGLAYSAVRPRVRHLGRRGDYLTGLACAYAYFVAFGIPFALFTDDEAFHSGTGVAVFFVVATIFGLGIGHSWFKTEPPPAP